MNYVVERNGEGMSLNAGIRESLLDEHGIPMLFPSPEAAVKLAKTGEQDIEKIAAAAHGELEKLLKEKATS